MAGRAPSRYAELDEYYLHPLADAADRGQLTVLVRGSGALVEDAEGRTYLDGLSGLWNTNLGHGRAELADAAADQMRRLAFGNTYSGFANVPALELAARLEALAYEGLRATFFTTSGVDANECAFKTARYYWRRQGKPTKVKILSLEHGFHGATLAGMSATGIPDYSEMFQPRLPEFIHVRSPYPYRCDFAAPGEGPGAAAARLLEETIQREGPESVAAFIAEPVQGAGGVIVPPADYFPRAREVCSRYDVLLIADEVITGFGRTGEWFGLTHWHVEPDVMTFAKGVTSAYLPLGGMMVTPRIASVIQKASASERWMHSSTYAGHPVCCAVGLRTLEIIETEKLVERVARLGRYLLGRLGTLLDLSCVGEVRGLGLMAAIELVSDRPTRAPFDPALGVGARVVRRAQQAGLIVRNRGDVVTLAPPFVISERQIDELASVLRRAVADTLEALP
ncbi:MAG: aspartate aminotransferase family protein [Candidatus Rokubacteria bacterium]|nr:aspartate aminotransferase family protein [Candidatus Rokubacteria bacterium]